MIYPQCRADEDGIGVCWVPPINKIVRNGDGKIIYHEGWPDYEVVYKGITYDTIKQLLFPSYQTHLP